MFEENPSKHPLIIAFTRMEKMQEALSLCRLTLAAESSVGFVPPSSEKSGAVGTETGRSGERALPA